MKNINILQAISNFNKVVKIAQTNKKVKDYLKDNVDLPIGATTKVPSSERGKKVRTFYITYNCDTRERWDPPGTRPENFGWYYFKETITKQFRVEGADLRQRVIKDAKITFSGHGVDSEIEYETQFLNLNHFTVMSKETFKKRVEVNKIRMFDCKVMKYDYMPDIDDISFENTEMMCVYQGLIKRYGNCKRPITQDTMFKLFNEYSINNYKKELKLTEGVDINMLQYFCMKKDITFLAFDLNNNRICKTISKNRNHKPLIIYCCDSHMYLVSDDKAVDSIINSNLDKKCSSQLYKEDKEVISEVIYYEYNDDEYFNDLQNGWNNILHKINSIPTAGCMIISDKNVNEIFNFIVKHTRTVPKISHRDRNNISKILFKREDKVIISIQVDPNYRSRATWKDVQALCVQINVPFTNQGMGSLMKQYYEKFMDKERIYINKVKYFEEHEKKCVQCGCSSNIQLDHIIAIANGGSPDDENNIQQLCKGCHYLKSRAEQNQGYVKYNKISSSFNNHVKTIFESDLMKKWAFNEKIGDKNYYHFKKYAYDMAKCRKNIAYYYSSSWCVFTVMDDVVPFDGNIRAGFYFVESKNIFPLRGNGWYSENMINHCLKHNIIVLEDIKYQIIPSLTLPSGYFKDFIDHVYNTFGDMSKIAINALIGCFYRQKMVQIKARYCKSKEDACLVFNSDTVYNSSIASYVKECGLYQIIHETEIKYEETESPLYLQILDEEALEMHKLSLLVPFPCYVNTDCIFSIKEVDLSMHEWEEGVPKYKPCEEKPHPEFESMAKYDRTDIVIPESKEWNVIDDSGDAKLLASKIVELNGCLINGRAGTGKSYLINEIVKLLDNNYKCLAPTNKAANIISGQTIHKFAGANGKKLSLKYLKNYNYIIVDEVSMMESDFYKLFLSIKNMRPDMKFIFVGDYDQLLPVNDRVKDCDYEGSRVLFELCCGNKLELTKCRRSDDVLFNMCKNVGDVDVSTFSKKVCRKSVCFTNAKRKAVNEYWMKKEALTTKHLVIPGHKFDPNSQDMKICINTPIIARVSDAELEIANNETFVVKDIKKNIIVLCNGLQIDKKDFNKYFYVAYCLTIHKSQGCTFSEEYTIYEWRLLDKRLRYVALSRATNIKNINII